MGTPFPALDATVEGSLLARVRAGGQHFDSALGDLFCAYRQPVLALCTSLTGYSSDAEDALQDVFVAVSRALPLFRGESKLSTWLYRIAIRSALEVKARRRHAEPLNLEWPGRNAERQLLARDEARKLAHAMDRLPAEQRVVLSLFALEGLPQREIADVLGVPEGTVWSRLNVARRKLADELGRSG